MQSNRAIMTSKEEFAENVRNITEKPSNSTSSHYQRPALQELPQDRSRTASRKRSRKSLLPQEIKDLPNPYLEDSEAVELNRRRQRPIRDEFEMVIRDPLEFPSVEPYHTKRNRKQQKQHMAENFEIHVSPDLKEPSTDRPASEITDEHRPRTSRGRNDNLEPPISFTTMFPSANQQQQESHLEPDDGYHCHSSVVQSEIDATADEQCSSQSEDEQGIPRKSRFLEGSMNNRSQGISSAWKEEMTTDGDASRLASEAQDKTQRTRIEGTESNLRRSTSRKLKKGGNHANASTNTVKDHTARPMLEPMRQKKKAGLRSAISFHGISDKFKFFGSKSAGKVPGKDMTNETENFKALMQDRKRKAEIAYAEQFGNKKQRASNDISGNQVQFSRLQPNNPTESQHTVSKSATTPSIPSSASTTIVDDLNRSKIRPRRESATLKKKVSRRDLEKENAHLRTLLAQQQRRNLRASMSVNDLTTDSTDLGDNADYLILTPGKGMGMVPGKNEMEDIPPVPKLPYALINASTESVIRGVGRPTQKAETNKELSFAERRRGEIIADGYVADDDQELTKSRKTKITSEEKKNIKTDDRDIRRSPDKDWDWPEDCF